MLPYPILLRFEVDGAFIVSRVRLSRGRALRQYQLEEALFPRGIHDFVDDDTWRTELWTPPVTYHDLFEAHVDEDLELGPVLVFARVLEPGRERRFAFTAPREYLTPSPLQSDAAVVLRTMIEGMGGYFGFDIGSTQDQLLIALPPESTFDPTADVDSLRGR